MADDKPKVRIPKKRFLNVLAYLGKITSSPFGGSKNIPDLLLPFVSKMTEFEAVLRDLIPKKIEALQLDHSIKDWQFVAYGYLRQDEPLLRQLEQLYTPTYTHLQAQGFIMALPEDFVEDLLWDTVIEIWKSENPEAAAAASPPSLPPSNRRADDEPIS